jgi:C1A family cysteine protease
MRLMGWVPDPYDSRDEGHGIRCSELDLGSEEQISLSWQMGFALDQGRLGSCVAQGVAKGIYAAHKRQAISFPEHISRLALYYLARAVIGKQHQHTGCHIRDAFKVLNIFGFCPEGGWPYDDEPGEDGDFLRMPPTNAFRRSFDQRGSGRKPAEYRRVMDTGTKRVDAVKQQLRDGRPVIFGTSVSKAFTMNVLPDGPIDPPPSDSIAGGHAMVICGFHGDSFDVLNSWGNSWGANGWGCFSADYIAWSATRDLWTVDVAPGFGL